MPSYYDNLVERLGVEGARAHMSAIRSKRRAHKGGGFNDPTVAKFAGLRSQEVKREKNEKENSTTKAEAET